MPIIIIITIMMTAQWSVFSWFLRKGNRLKSGNLSGFFFYELNPRYLLLRKRKLKLIELWSYLPLTSSP
jgi:hypothetical protein